MRSRWRTGERQGMYLPRPLDGQTAPRLQFDTKLETKEEGGQHKARAGEQRVHLPEHFLAANRCLNNMGCHLLCWLLVLRVAALPAALHRQRLSEDYVFHQIAAAVRNMNNVSNTVPGADATYL